MTPRSVFLAGVAAAVAIAFADSSIVVLALPELYGRFDTSIEGVAWVITSYNLVLAVAALGLVLVVHRVRAGRLLAVGSLVFLGASIALFLVVAPILAVMGGGVRLDHGFSPRNLLAAFAVIAAPAFFAVDGVYCSNSTDGASSLILPHPPSRSAVHVSPT